MHLCRNQNLLHKLFWNFGLSPTSCIFVYLVLINCSFRFFIRSLSFKTVFKRFFVALLIGSEFSVPLTKICKFFADEVQRVRNFFYSP